MTKFQYTELPQEIWVVQIEENNCNYLNGIYDTREDAYKAIILFIHEYCEMHNMLDQEEDCIASMYKAYHENETNFGNNFVWAEKVHIMKIKGVDVLVDYDDGDNYYQKATEMNFEF